MSYRKKIALPTSKEYVKQNFYLESTHYVVETELHFRGALYLEIRYEVFRDRDQRVFGPPRKPIDGTARYQSGKLHGAGPKLFPDLEKKLRSYWGIDRL